jgi:hypothetical protein
MTRVARLGRMSGLEAGPTGLVAAGLLPSRRIGFAATGTPRLPLRHGRDTSRQNDQAARVQTAGPAATEEPNLACA